MSINTPDAHGSGNKSQMGSSTTHKLAGTLHPTYIAGGHMSIGNEDFTVHLRKDIDSRLIAHKDEHYTIEVDGFPYGKTNWFTLGRGGERLEWTGIIMDPSCMHIIDNKLYVRDSNYLWSVYRLEKDPRQDNPGMKFVREKRMRYLPGSEFNVHTLQDGNIRVFNYKNPKDKSNYIEQNDNRPTYTRVVMKDSFDGTESEKAGDLPLTNVSEYDLSSIRVSKRELTIRKKDGTIEKFMGKLNGNEFQDVIFEKVE